MDFIFEFLQELTNQCHKMFKTQVEPRAAGEWFHCQVLNILWRHFIVYKSIDHRKLPSIFTITRINYGRNLLYFPMRKRARYI